VVPRYSGVWQSSGCARAQDNLHTVKELVGAQSDTGMSRGVQTSIPARA